MKAAALRSCAIACCLALALVSAFAQGSGPSGRFRYELEISPGRLFRGGKALIVLQIEGMTAASTAIESILLSEGLELESQATRPYVFRGGASGVELRLGFVLRERGALRVEKLIIASVEGRLSIDPLVLVVEDPIEEGDAPSVRPVLWEWRAPARARRYDEIEVRLVRADGREAESGLIVSFEPPQGATMEGSGYLSWRLTPLIEGRLVLPDAELRPKPGSRARRGEALAATIVVAGSAAAPSRAADAQTTAPSQAPLQAPKAAVSSDSATLCPGAELAGYYRTMRRKAAFEVEYRKAAAAASALLSRHGIEGDAEAPRMDILPPPTAFLIPSAFLFAAAVVAGLLLSRRRAVTARADRPQKSAAAGGLRRASSPFAAILFAALAVLSLSLAGASALERRRQYAVVWTDELTAIPSPLAELTIESRRGSTAQLRLRTGDYAALSFADGVIAWAPSAYIFEY